MSRHLPLCSLLILALAAGAQARVVEFQVIKREPAFEGQSFGNVGAYEKLQARVTMAVKPEDPYSAGIVDLKLAPKNAAGEVEFRTQVDLLKPADMSRGNGKLLYDVLNRGRKLGLVLMNDAPASNDPSKAADAGNGFLMEQGYTIVWSGWQGDLNLQPPLIGLEVPTLTGVTGTSREEFVFDHTKNPATATLTYPAADLDPAKATLTVRAKAEDARTTPAGLSFQYLSPTEIEITRPTGFDAGAIYEFIYPAKDPKVLGLGFAAVRDVVSYLRYEGNAANPLAGQIRHAYGLGISQSGRFLRDLLYQGFNEDEAKRPVFDGLMPHIAGARRTFTNERFAQPGRYSRQHEDHDFPGDQFPFSYAVSYDPLSKRTDGLMKKCQAARSGCPKVIQTDTDTEMFQARAGLLVLDAAGQPLDVPTNVRLYLLVGLQHFTAPGASSKPQPACLLPDNPLHAGAAMRALLVVMDEWVTHNTLPPASRFPTLKGVTLVLPEDAGYPALPGLRYQGLVNRKSVVDHQTMPPVLGTSYPVLVARVDPDGHALAGLRLPAIEAPIASYLGWNPRKPGFAEGQLCSTTGAMIPLAKTRAEREAKNDPRLSLEERYAEPNLYVKAVERAAEHLVRDRLLLPADAARITAAAAAKGFSQPAQ